MSIFVGSQPLQAKCTILEFFKNTDRGFLVDMLKKVRNFWGRQILKLGLFWEKI